MTKLIKLSAESKDDREKLYLTELILNLKDLRRRDVVSWLEKLYAYCTNFNKMNLCSEAAEMLEQTSDE